MITNWGAHHIDIAHWAMGQELGGPLTVDAQAKFMQNDAWTVHSTYHVEFQYPKKVSVILDNSFQNGIRFEGDDGWVFCARSEEKVTASDPTTPAGREALKPLRASDPKILLPLDDHAVRWMPSRTHHGKLAREHRRQPPAYRAHPAIRAQPASLRHRVDQHETRPQTGRGMSPRRCSRR